MKKYVRNVSVSRFRHVDKV